jgi:hypothetical protein
MEMAGGAGLGAGTTVAGCGVAAGGCAGDELVLVSGDEAAGVVESCPIALRETSREAVIIHFQVRMAQILSVLHQ